MKNKTGFLGFIRFWVIIIILMIGGSMLVFNIVTSYHDFNSRAAQMRSDYTAGQKQIIKQEVNQVVELIHTKIARTDELVRNNIKSKVYEAYSIAQNIYQENKAVKNDNEIKKMIIDALRPIRSDQGNGYFLSPVWMALMCSLRTDPSWKEKIFWICGMRKADI